MKAICLLPALLLVLLGCGVVNEEKEPVAEALYTDQGPTLPPVTIGPTSQEPIPAGTKTGVERWDVKTLQDSAAAKITWIPVQKPVSYLAGLKPPKVLGNEPRGVLSDEFTVVTIRVKALSKKCEADGDYHSLWADDAGTVIGCEFPVYVGSSPYKTQMISARQSFEAQFGASKSVDDAYHKLDGSTWFVTGVVFADRVHGEKGLKNGIELHPVLGIARAPK